MKRALITGITGQDGPYLADLLLKKGYKVYGTYRRVSTPNFWRLQQMKVLDKITLIPCDLADTSSILETVKNTQPDEVYNLAAQSFVGASFDQPLHTTDIDGAGATRFLEIIRHFDNNIKFYQASTSELYGSSRESPQHEKTPFLPNSPYAAAKLYSFHMTRIYREAYGMFATNGILFNHESPLRGLEFVTRKITNSVAKIKLDLQKGIHLGNLDARRDWGFAPEYVDAIWKMMQQRRPDDFVIATGETHSVGEFAQAAFDAVGLNSKDYVTSDKRLHRPLDVQHLCGNNEKAQHLLKWKPKVTFKRLVEIMVKADLERWEKYQQGKIFPWDAPNYSSEIDILSRAVSREGSRPRQRIGRLLGRR
jgi:GDPmannose 4,6-dehydratase